MRAHARFKNPETPIDEEDEGDSWGDVLVRKIVDNVQVKIERVHLRFEEVTAGTRTATPNMHSWVAGLPPHTELTTVRARAPY